MTAVHILAIDFAKRSFQVCATGRCAVALFNRVLSRARLQRSFERAATVHRRYGGPRDLSLLGPIRSKLWPQPVADPADLCKAPEE